MANEEQTPDPLTQAVIGWAGWWLPTPEPWRFFKMDGSYRQGFLVAGDDERPRLEMAWAWVTRRGLKVPSYIRSHLLARIPRSERADAAGLLSEISLPGFDHAVALTLDRQTRYVGYCSRTHRILHWVYHHGSAYQNRRFSEQCLPLWRDQPLSEPSKWRFFDVSFTVPAGFRLHYGTLNLGDMEVILIDPSVWGARPRLCVRHIYPATLALSRQPLTEWLQGLFDRRRSFYRNRARPKSPPLRFDHSRAPGWRIEAVLQFLWRFPLRLLVYRFPSRTEASIHHIEDLDKLLYIQMSGRRAAIADTRQFIIDSLPPASSNE